MIIGIDPGLTGAVALLKDEGNVMDVFDMPTIQVGDGSRRVANIVNAAGLRQATQFPPDDVKMVVLEMPQAMGFKISPLALMSISHTAGVVEGVMSVFPMTRVAPHIWKKSLGLSRDKEQSRSRAQELFPTVDLSLKKYHNRAEALLLAYWWLKNGR